MWKFTFCYFPHGPSAWCDLSVCSYIRRHIFPLPTPSTRTCLTAYVPQALEKSHLFISPSSVRSMLGIRVIHPSKIILAARPSLRLSHHAATWYTWFSRSPNMLHTVAHLSLSMCRVQFSVHSIHLKSPPIITSHRQSSQTTSVCHIWFWRFLLGRFAARWVLFHTCLLSALCSCHTESHFPIFGLQHHSKGFSTHPASVQIVTCTTQPLRFAYVTNVL